MSNENQQNQTEDQQTKQEEQSTKKESWLKFSLGMTAVVAISAAVGYAAGFATTKLLSK
jgi:hypothetical protein|nr:MAG TPA: hypothetical protein [Caudoviricetes sp.]DAR82030.1 MAG TPA: hypothetical protein [Caudoviricetes sp.]